MTVGKLLKLKRLPDTITSLCGSGGARKGDGWSLIDSVPWADSILQKSTLWWHLLASEKWMRHVSVAFTLMNLEAEQHKCEHRATKKKRRRKCDDIICSKKKEVKEF